MTGPMLDPPIADAAPSIDGITDYDRMHLVTYLRLLDADAEGAEPGEVAHIVLGIDPRDEPERALRVHASHLARARWMTEHGYRHLVLGT
jgi:hypothetical protein